ncbi:MAG: PAS domain-containing sensor histidine kinase [Spirochaetes bacterium]|nr:MAG: PAS domain-containing sensor histidine kinase [Spirochaetota bacterium]
MAKIPGDNGAMDTENPPDDLRQADFLSREFLMGILDDSVNGFFILDARFRIIYGNRSFRSMFREYELSDVPVHELFTGNPRRTIKRKIKTVFSRQVPEIIEIEVRIAGKTRYFLVSLNPVRRKSARARVIYGFIQDVTELKNLQYQLENERNYNRSIIETVKLGFVLVNDSNEYLDYNGEYLAILGRDEKDLEGKTFYDFTEPSYIKNQEAMMKEMVKSCRPFILEKEFVRKDGSTVPVLLSMSRLLDKQGRPIGNFAFIRDISDQKQIENTLIEQNRNIVNLVTIYNYASARFLNCSNRDEAFGILSESLHGIIAFDKIELLIKGNGGFSSVFGDGVLAQGRKEPVSDKNSLTFKLLDARESPILVKNVMTELNDEDFSVFPGLTRHKSALFIPVPVRGSFGLAVIMAFEKPLSTPDEYVMNILIGISNLASITIEKILSVEEQNMMRLTLDRNERLTSMGRIIAGVAHEINNPLSIMQLDLDEMKDIASDLETRDRASFDELVKSLQEEISRLSGLVKQLKDYSNPSSIGLESVQIDDMIRDFPVKIFLKNLQKKGIRVKLRLNASRVSVQMPKNRLIQVLMNLLQNAADALSGRPDPELIVETGASGGKKAQVFIAVLDNGAGIPSTHLQKVFEPFFSTKKSEGTGLGLSISYSIVKTYRGEIQVESEEGEGTRFTISFPESSVSP